MGALWRTLIFGLVVGIMFGVGVGWFWGQSAAKKEHSRPRPKERPEPCPEQPEQPPALGLVLRRAGGQFKVILDGVQYKSYSSMPQDSRQRLLAYLKLARDWIQPQPKAPTARPQPVEAAQTDLLGKDEEPHKDKSIAEQIDDVLQRLAAKEGRKDVRIVPSLTGGVNIVVGANRYESVEDVPDESARTLVLRAVKIWEKEAGR